MVVVDAAVAVVPEPVDLQVVDKDVAQVAVAHLVVVVLAAVEDRARFAVS